MLVFTRKRHEAIMIGDGIEIRVLRVGKDGVRIGVSAPASVSVHRREVYDQIRDENRIAARTVSSVEGPGRRAAQAPRAAGTSPTVEPDAARTGSDRR